MSDETHRQPTPEETAKIRAELAKLEIESAKLQAEVEHIGSLSLATAEKARWEAEAARLDATIKLFAVQKATEEEEARTKSDEHCRVYQFNGGVDTGSADKCMAKLRLWDRLDPDCDIEVILNSPGGSVIAGMALFDLLSRLSKRGGGRHSVSIGAQGYAASMAGILLQAGDVRWIGAQSYLMIHEISAGTGGKIGEMKDDVDFYERICARVVEIFVARSGGKISRSTFKRKWQRIDWWLLADEALKLGFVDEIR
jgi:ATP-dependent Clp endopeptidase proteolytic subunit ClpP